MSELVFFDVDQFVWVDETGCDKKNLDTVLFITGLCAVGTVYLQLEQCLLRAC